MRVLPRPLRSLTLVLCLLGALSPIARAQITFFDGFEGPEFHPRWTASPRSDWTYDFEGQRLNIRGQSVPGPVGITTPIGPFAGNFSVSCLLSVGLDRTGMRSFRMRVDGEIPVPTAPLAAIGYIEYGGGGPLIAAMLPLGPLSIPAPQEPLGGYRLEIRRDGTNLKVLLGQSVLGFQPFPSVPVRSVSFEFFDGGRFLPMSMDSALVVVSPSGLAVIMGAAICHFRRRTSHARFVGVAAAIREVRERVSVDLRHPCGCVVQPGVRQHRTDRRD